MCWGKHSELNLVLENSKVGGTKAVGAEDGLSDGSRVTADSSNDFADDTTYMLIPDTIAGHLPYT
jgi:hypothetical protein